MGPDSCVKLKFSGFHSAGRQSWAVDEAEFRDLLALYHFELPEELIASHPLPARDASRLLVVERKTSSMREESFRDLADLLSQGDTLVFNQTRVSFRRLKLKSGARSYEPLLLEQVDGMWHALVAKASRLKEGTELFHETGLVFRARGRSSEKIVLEAMNPPTDWEAFFAEYGDVPIPPYLNRPSDPEDRVRYNTVFASSPASVAAPTAGLHFTEDTLESLRKRGIETAFVELAIGTGTFAPLRLKNFEENRLHREFYSIAESAAKTIARAGSIVAVGTTTLRALESTLRQRGRIEPGAYSTEIFIRPPDQMTSANGLITNFHLPESSLFMLVCAFAGTELMKEAYRKAVLDRFRFFSYGDAMLII